MSDEKQFPEGAPGSGESGSGDAGDVMAGSRPAVAAAPGKFLIVGILAFIFLAIIIKSLFFSSPPPAAPVKPRAERVSEGAAPPNITPAELPPPPSPIVPVPQAPPQSVAPLPQVVPPPPQISMTPAVSSDQEKARTHAGMFVVSSSSATGGGSATASRKNSLAASSDPNSSFAQGIFDSGADTVEATRVQHLDRTIIQGKFIQAVLETAIDSSLPGPIRAITSHDTYAENTRRVLIPKGSRLIGVYNSAVKRGQARVFIIWTRVVRPDGVDIAINSPGVDALGRAGMGGYVDNKYFEAFSTAILTSAVDIGVAAVGDALFGNQQQTTTTGGGGTTTTSSDTATAMQTAIQNIGSVGQSIVGNAVNLSPVIHVDQGELINVFVNKDVVFPEQLLGIGTVTP